MFFPVFFFPCYLHNGQVRISVGIPCVGVLHMLHASLFSWSCVGVCVSRVFKDQVYGVPKLLFFDWLFGWWTVATVSDILSFFSNYLYVSVLLFVKAELTLEGIRQFHVAVELEKRKLDTFCDLHETRRVGSLGFPPVCWSRFGLRAHSRFLAVFAQGTLISRSESNLAKNLESVNGRKWMVEFEKFKLGCLDFCCVNVEG